jgi:branched-chain amino acid transport system ATP-binding protein
LTVTENLTAASRAGRWDLKAVYELFPHLAERCTNMGNQLSGASSKCWRSRALMTNPLLPLLDERLEGGPIVAEELTASIARMIADQGTAVILIEQYAEVALSLTGDASVMERGVIVHRAPRTTCSMIPRLAID